jgi:hypothetical protein
MTHNGYTWSADQTHRLCTTPGGPSRNHQPDRSRTQTLASARLAKRRLAKSLRNHPHRGGGGAAFTLSQQDVHLYSPRAPMLGADRAIEAMVAPGSDCTRVFSVSRGCMMSVEVPLEMPPASAARSSSFPVPTSPRSTGTGGPAKQTDRPLRSVGTGGAWSQGFACGGPRGSSGVVHLWWSNDSVSCVVI